MGTQYFPSWRYNATANPVLVQDPAAAKALGPDWYESPADIPTESEGKAKPRRRRRRKT
jgi:hypothetical protein